MLEVAGDRLMDHKGAPAGGAVRLSALLVAAGSLLSGPVAMLLVFLVAPQPAWTGVSAFVEHYHPVQALPYALGYILLAGFVLFAASCHAQAPAAARTRSSAALVFTGIYATLVFLNYSVQLGYLPHVLHRGTASIAFLTMANPNSFAWVLEMFGYAAMGVATWLLAADFQGSYRADAVRFLLISNGVMSIAGAACTALYEGWVFSVGGLVAFACWNVLIVVCFLLIAIDSGA